MRCLTRRRPASAAGDHRRSGFTLVELLVRIAIISTLAAFLLPNFEDIISRSRESAARANAPFDLHDLCEVLDPIMFDIHRDVPLNLASIESELPERFEVITEGEGAGVDVAANGFRYHLELSQYTQHILERYGNPPPPVTNIRYRMSFLICGTPASPELINSEFCLVHRIGDDCQYGREFVYDEHYERNKEEFLSRYGSQFLYEAIQDGYDPQQFVSLIRQVDPGLLKQLVSGIDANKDDFLTLKEIKDLEAVPVVGDIIHDWAEHRAIGKYGERIDQIGVAVSEITFDSQPAEFLTRYNGIEEVLQAEEPTGRIRGISGSVVAAQQAADKGDTRRELQHIGTIRRKSEDALLSGDLSADSFDVIDYSLEVRKVYLEGNDP